VQFSGIFPGVLNPVVGIDFLINNTQYQETAVPTVVNVGDAEEWQLVVQGPHHGGTEGHPFHIHVNSFEVISIGGKPVAPGTIQDTVWVAEKSTVVIRIRFKQWTGKSVYHCHILPHEDTGMMQNFLILPKGKPRQH
jgi:FtsP/CotA-like multicopper oxidase with cupredoxin domain